MNSTDPPHSPNSVLLFVLNLIHKVFGHVQWQAPEWIHWIGPQFRKAGRFPIADRKRLITYVEIDRCVTDAVALVANCRLGKRALKFRDWGKVAATFCDLQTGRAVRIAAKESSKQAAKDLFPELPREEGQQKAYAQLPDDVLFSKQWVKVDVQPEDLPGFKGPRIVCAECGEGINFKREVTQNGRTLCRACAGGRYYSAL